MVPSENTTWKTAHRGAGKAARTAGGVAVTARPPTEGWRWGRLRARKPRMLAAKGRARSRGCHNLTVGRQQTEVAPGEAGTHVPFETTWPERRKARLGCRLTGGVCRTGGSAPRSTAATLRRARTAVRLRVSHHQPTGGAGAGQGLATAGRRSASTDGEATARGSRGRAEGEVPRPAGKQGAGGRGKPSGCPARRPARPRGRGGRGPRRRCWGRGDTRNDTKEAG